MPKALVFINIQSDSLDLVKNLKNIEGVSEAHASRGMYDAVAMVQADSFAKIREIVARSIRSLDNVKATLTLALAEPS